MLRIPFPNPTTGIVYTAQFILFSNMSVRIENRTPWVCFVAQGRAASADQVIQRAPVSVPAWNDASFTLNPESSVDASLSLTLDPSSFNATQTIQATPALAAVFISGAENFTSAQNTQTTQQLGLVNVNVNGGTVNATITNASINATITNPSINANIVGGTVNANLTGPVNANITNASLNIGNIVSIDYNHAKPAGFPWTITNLIAGSSTNSGVIDTNGYNTLQIQVRATSAYPSIPILFVSMSESVDLSNPVTFSYAGTYLMMQLPLLMRYVQIRVSSANYMGGGALLSCVVNVNATTAVLPTVLNNLNFFGVKRVETIPALTGWSYQLPVNPPSVTVILMFTATGSTNNRINLCTTPGVNWVTGYTAATPVTGAGIQGGIAYYYPFAVPCATVAQIAGNNANNETTIHAFIVQD